MIADRSRPRLAANNLAALIRQVVVTETILSPQCAAWNNHHGALLVADVMERF